MITGGTVTNFGMLDANTGATNAINNAILITNNLGATIEATGASVGLQIETPARPRSPMTARCWPRSAARSTSTASRSTNTATGLVQVDASSTLDLTNATIAGGLLTGAGTIQTLGSGSDSTLDGSSGHTVTIDTGTTVTANLGTTLDLTGAITNNGTLTTALTGGTIDLENATVTGGIQINHGMVDATGTSSATSLTFLGSAGTLEVNTAATLTVTNALAIGANTLKLDGASSTLTDAAGITLAGGTISGLGALAANTNLTGWGTVSIPLNSADTVTASGGTLEFTNTVDSTTASTLPHRQRGELSAEV